jgi:hypothetical protein
VIPLDALLRDATDAPRRNLVTRPTGAAVRDRVLDTLRGAPRTEALLDFSRIGLVDFSCADEVVAKLVIAIHELPVSRVILHGIREDQAEAIDHALARHGLTVLALELDTARPILLGEVPADWRTVFDVLRLRGRVAAAPIAEQLAWAVDRVQLALDGLVASRCIVRAADGSCDVGVLA